MNAASCWRFATACQNNRQPQRRQRHQRHSAAKAGAATANPNKVVVNKTSSVSSRRPQRGAVVDSAPAITVTGPMEVAIRFTGNFTTQPE